MRLPRPKRRGTSRIRAISLAGVALFAAAAGTTAYALEALRPIELNTVDTRFRISGKQPAPKDIVIVGVDATSLRELRVGLKVPRALHAQVLDRLHRDRPRLIIFDYQFIGKRPGYTGFNRAVSAARPVVLATHDDANGYPVPVPGGAAHPRRSGAKPGSVGVPADADGVTRRILYAPVATKSLSVVAAELAQ